MITIYKKEVRDKAFRTLKRPEFGSWIRVQNRTKDDFNQLMKLIPNLDKDILEDTLDSHEMPRIEKERGYIYLLVRAPVINNGQVKTSPFLFIVSDKHFITVEPNELNYLERLLHSSEDINTTQRSKILVYSLIYLSREYTLHAEDLFKTTQNKKVIIKKLKSADIYHLVEVEETLTSFITSLLPTINVMERILSGKLLTFHKNDEDLVEDLIIEYKQTLSLSQTTVQSIRTIRDAYSTIINYNLNTTIKFLTSFTIILTVPTIIASFYGMNVGLPFQSHPFGFWFVLLGTSVIVLLVFYIFYRKDWL